MTGERTPAPQQLNIAVIGGGSRCLTVLKMLESRSFEHLQAKVVGVADRNPKAKGRIYARKKGIFTTNDGARLFDLKDLDLIIELTDDRELLNNLAASKPESVKYIGYTASRLFHDIVAIYQKLEEQREEVSLAKSFARALEDATSEGVLVLDKNYRILRINNAALAMAAMTEDEALGKYCFQVTHQSIGPCHSPDNPCPMSATLETGKSAHAFHEHLQPDGEAHYCDVTTYPL
ncbi:MAG: PAS domain-containing protein [Desulfarculaceae bacterium]